MPKLSVTMIVLNEEDRIGPTLDAIACADEILVVDGGSTDRTVEICEAHGCRVVRRPFDDYGPQKQFATAQAAHDWILNLDADEVLTPALNEEIRLLMARDEIPESAFRVPMQLVFMGQPFRHGRHARELHIRLFDRRRADYDDRSVHEKVVPRGAVGELENLLFHHSFRSVSHCVEKMNFYTSRGAQDLARRGARRSPALMAASAPFYFLEGYLLRGNVLNGTRGFYWSVLYAVSPLLKYVKLAEAELER